jgi:hypothetical protein
MNDRERWEDASHKGECVSVCAGNPKGLQATVNISLSLYANDGTGPAEYISGRPIAPSSGSVEALYRAQQWLKNCDKKHERCAPALSLLHFQLDLLTSPVNQE